MTSPQIKQLHTEIIEELDRLTSLPGPDPKFTSSDGSRQLIVEEERGERKVTVTGPKGAEIQFRSAHFCNEHFEKLKEAIEGEGTPNKIVEEVFRSLAPVGGPQSVVLKNMSLSGLNLTAAALEGVRMEHVKLQNVNLQNAFMKEATLEDVTFENCNLNQVRLTRLNENSSIRIVGTETKLDHLHLRTAESAEPKLLKAISFHDLNLCGANVSGIHPLHTKLESLAKRLGDPRRSDGAAMAINAILPGVYYDDHTTFFAGQRGADPSEAVELNRAVIRALDGLEGTDPDASPDTPAMERSLSEFTHDLKDSLALFIRPVSSTDAEESFVFAYANRQGLDCSILYELDKGEPPKLRLEVLSDPGIAPAVVDRPCQIGALLQEWLAHGHFPYTLPPRAEGDPGPVRRTPPRDANPKKWFAELTREVVSEGLDLSSEEGRLAVRERLDELSLDYAADDKSLRMKVDGLRAKLRDEFQEEFTLRLRVESLLAADESELRTTMDALAITEWSHQERRAVELKLRSEAKTDPRARVALREYLDEVKRSSSANSAEP